MRTGRGEGRRSIHHRHTRAIIAAAERLTTDRGSRGFTVHDVAEAAGVSRRTVFNHFPSIDVLLVCVCDKIVAASSTRSLRAFDDALAKLGDVPGRDERALDALCTAVEEADLVAAMAGIATVFSDVKGPGERQAAIARAALELFGDRLRERVDRSTVHVDPLTLDFTIAMLLTGVVVIGRQWPRELDGATSSEAYARWSAPMSELVVLVRDGYRSGALG